MHTRAKGYKGEDRAVEYLLTQEYKIISRNYQSRAGEIDCIAEAPDGTLVFFEVKTGQSSRYGHPFFRITKGKQKKMMTLARLYLAEHDLNQKACRFDAIAITNGKIEHLKNAFLL